MVSIDGLEKCIVFGGAGKVGVPVKSKGVKRKTLVSRRQTYIPPATSQGTERESNMWKLRSMKNFLKDHRKEVEKYGKSFYRAGSTSIALTSLVNHGTLTVLKAQASAVGEDYRYFDEKMKMYLKPHFALPSRWDQPRITFGTPWYF